MGFFDVLKELLGLKPHPAFGAPRVPVPPPLPSRPAPSGAPPAAAPPSVAEARLDASIFRPPPPSGLLAAARALRRDVGGIWFGRRDLIPPVEDPRTLLIDQGMVADGFLEPEELERIHAVGRRMDEVRPDLALASTRARAAVAAKEGERAALKERRKAEAAERRAKHAEDVARRRREDVVFLGRGVSRGLSDRRSDVERLSAAGLPVLSTPADVAAAIGIDVPRLRWLCFHSEASPVSHYVRFEVPKRSGGTRLLASPHAHLRQAQEWVLASILSRVPVHDAAHGFVPGRSTVTNARPHVGRAVVVNFDLRDFFPTITFPRVKGLFRSLGYSPAASTVLALLCTDAPRQEALMAGMRLFVACGPRALPQGACTSPALSNLVARNLDARLMGTARALGFAYTRYADDLSFSGGDDALPRIAWLMARARHVAQDEGFEIHEEKTRVLRRNQSQRVTGIVVNDRLGVPRATVRRLRAILDHAEREGLAAQNRTNEPDFEAWLDGMIAYVTMVSPDRGGELRSKLEAVRGR